MTLNGKTIQTAPVAVADQPGFSGDGDYMVAKATTGGYRLYAAVGGNWMDASLADDARLAEFVNPAAILGSIKTPKKAAASRENGKKGGRYPHAVSVYDAGEAQAVENLIKKYRAKK